MKPRNQALDRIVRAERRVKDVADQWSAVDLSRIGSCVSALEAAATDLCAAKGILKGLPASNGSLLRTSVLDLQRAAGRLERLVDASAAFLRSAPGLACDRPVLYQAGGSIHQVAPPSEAPGLKG
jgi:hypothetical protein